MSRAYDDYLRDILSMIAKAQQFVTDVEKPEFVTNDEKIFAVIRALEVIGEAVKFIPQSTAKPFWPQAAAFNNNPPEVATQPQ